MQNKILITHDWFSASLLCSSASRNGYELFESSDRYGLLNVIDGFFYSLGKMVVRYDGRRVWTFSLLRQEGCVQFSAQDMQPLVNHCIGRRDDYALQRDDGSYVRVGRALTYEVLMHHLQRIQTLGTYVIDEQDTCRFAVFDSDLPDGLVQLVAVQSALLADGIVSYLEASRRGGHLWVFFASRLPPDLVRRWLLPYAPGGMEFYPKQAVRPGRPGSLIRVPLGVHRLTGRRYPFIERVDGRFVPVVRSVSAALPWLSTVERVQLPAAVLNGGAPNHVTHPQPATQENILQKRSATTRPQAPTTITQWCLQQDALRVIGRYVSLDTNGLGCCPFGWHHSDGKDSHPSLWAYAPAPGDVCCWYCHTWQRGGSLFDFLRFYYRLDAKTLWRCLLAGEQL